MAENQFVFTNFTKLNKETLLEILKWRNSEEISQYMLTKHIGEANHLKFCESLKDRPLDKYIYITLNGQPYGVYSIHFKDETYKEIADLGGYSCGNAKIPFNTISSVLVCYYKEQHNIEQVHFKIKSDNIRQIWAIILRCPSIEYKETEDFCYFKLASSNYAPLADMINYINSKYNADCVFNL